MELRKTRYSILDAGYSIFFGISVLVIAAGFYSTARGADWPNWRGPNHNGISDETGWSTTWPKDGVKILWKATLGTGFCSIAVSGGRVWTMGNANDTDTLYCLDANTGKEIWKQSYPCPLFNKNHEGGPSATPTVDGDSIYTFSKNGDALCFKADTGKIAWQKNLPKELGIKYPTWYFAGSPFVFENLIILNAGTAGTALNKSDGKVVWQNGDGPPGYATAVPVTIGGEKCVVIFGSNELIALAAATGKVLWRVPWKTSYDVNAADPIIFGEMIFVSSGYNRGCGLFKIGADGATKVWENKNMRNHFNSCVLWNGSIYGFDESDLRCLDWKSGEAKWTQEGLGKGSLMLADGKLIILSEKGKLVIAPASPDGFKELCSAQILTGKCWTMPVLANGRIYARNNPDGQLVCVDVSGK